MSHTGFDGRETRHELTLVRARDFRCVAGVNMGDPFDLEDLCLGDAYRMPDVDAQHMAVLTGPGLQEKAPSGYRLAEDSVLGQSNTSVEIGPVLTAMCGAGTVYRLRTLHVGGDLYLMPLGLVNLQSPLSLIGVGHDATPLPQADVTTLGMAPGTRVSLADGSLKAIDDLEVGDLVLTRDSGAMPVRCVLRQSFPAVGPSARVVIRANTFANDRDLVVSAAHRLMAPGRRSAIAQGKTDHLAPARQLVNGLTITHEAGGQVEYAQIVLDSHEIIYAEGIPSESMLLSPARRAGLTPTLEAQLLNHAPGLIHEPHPLLQTRPQKTGSAG